MIKIPVKKYFNEDDVNEVLKDQNIICLEFGGASYKKSRFKCLVCNNEWVAYGNDIICGKKGCPFCNKHFIVKTLEDANDSLKRNGIFGITCIEYGGQIKAKSKFSCDNCGREFYNTIDKLKYYAKKDISRACPYCKKSGCVPYLSVEIINEKLKDRQIPLECIECYGSNGESTFKCIKCGGTFKKSYHNIMSPRRKSYCPHCDENAPKRYATMDDVNEYLSAKKIPITCVEYAGNGHGKSKFRCNIHNIDFICEFNKVKAENQRCPKCTISKGENRIFDYLTSKNIKFETQKRFDGCRYKKLLRFDFYVSSLNCAIEFDGTQHFKPHERFGGEEAFKEVQARDNTKNEYCRKNNIKLIRISYKDFDKIEDILDNELK